MPGAASMDIALLLKQARERLGWSQAEAARRLGVTRSTINSWEKGRSAPKRHRAAKVAKTYNLPLSAIAGDPGHVNVAFPASGALSYRKVPLLDWVDAGRGAELAVSYVFDGTHEFIETTFPVPERAFALTIHGPSMEPEIYEGDVIIIDPNLSPRADDVVVAELLAKGESPGPGDVTCKRYRPRGPTNGSPIFDLIPNNPDFPTITVNKNNPGRIVGIVIEVHHRLRR